MKNLAKNIKRVGLVGNASKVSCAAVVRKAASLISASGRAVCTDRPTADFCRTLECAADSAAELARICDLLLVFGGDGTMLRVASQVAGSHTAILGINIGSLGFLTAVSSSELSRALRCIWNGEFKFETRTLIEAHGQCEGSQVRCTALNDIVVSRGMATRLIELEVRVDGDPLTRYRCDGLIVSTPTGSTAYSLAAGGAVIFPTANVVALTPICPHTLSNRSLILPLTSHIEIKVVSLKPVTMLHADGENISEMSPGDSVTISRSRKTLRLMHLSGSSFCETLRLKLHWRGTALPT